MGDQSTAAMVRTQWILFLALFSSLAIYGVVAWVVLQQPGTPTNLPPPVVYALCGTALTLCAVTPLVRRRLMPAEGSGRAGASKLASAQIVSWALCEAIAVLGIVLVMLTRQMIWFYALGALAAMSMFLYRPNEDLIRRVIGG